MLAKKIKEPLLQSNQVEDEQYDGGQDDQRPALFYDKQYYKRTKYVGLRDEEIQEIVNDDDDKKLWKKMGNSFEKFDDDEKVEIGDDNPPPKIDWAKEPTKNFTHDEVKKKMADYARGDYKSMSIEDYLMELRKVNFIEKFKDENNQFFDDATENTDKKCAEVTDQEYKFGGIENVAHDFVFYKEKILKVTKTIEKLERKDNQNGGESSQKLYRQLRLRVSEFNIDLKENHFDEQDQQNYIINEILVDNKEKTIGKKPMFLLDVFSKCYYLDCHKFIFFKVCEDDPTKFTFMSKDLKNNTPIIKSKPMVLKKNNGEHQEEMKNMILGVVFTNSIEDTDNTDDRSCFKCLLKKDHSHDENSEPVWISVLSKRDNKNEKVILSICKLPEFIEDDPDSSLIDKKDDPDSGQIDLKIEHYFKYFQITQDYEIGICLGRWQITHGKTVTDYLVLGKRIKPTELSPEIKIMSVEKNNEEYVLKKHSQLIKDFSKIQVKNQFEEFYENYIHKIFVIDKIKAQVHKNQAETERYISLMNFQTHNKYIENAFNECFFEEERFLKNKNYNILTFRNETCSIIQIVDNRNNKTLYFKTDPKVKDKIPIRFARQWNPEEVDNMAACFYNNNKGLMQIHPKYDNVFVDQKKKIVINKRVNASFKEFLSLQTILGDSDEAAKRNNSSISILKNKFATKDKRLCDQGHEMVKEKIQKKSPGDCCIKNCKKGKKIELNIQQIQKENDNYYFKCIECPNKKYHFDCAPQNHSLEMFKGGHQNELEEKYYPFHNKSRAIKLAFDNRKVFPRLIFDEELQQTKIQIIFDQPDKINGEKSYSLSHEVRKGEKVMQEILEVPSQIEYAPQRTVMCASSVVEKVQEKQDFYRQNFQIALLDKSGLWVSIKEFCLEWYDSENCVEEKVKLQFVGTKLVILRKPIDLSQGKKVLNFMPYYKRDEKGHYNYIISGTQILPTNYETNSDHIILENFKNYKDDNGNFSHSDFQFVGDIFASGYKIYVEEGNHTKQKFILFESQFKESVWNQDQDRHQFSSVDLHILMEQQIIVMMNMVPFKDVLSGKNFFQLEHDDFLAPLEVLQGCSICSFELSGESYIKSRGIESEQKIKSLLEKDFAFKLLTKEVNNVQEKSFRKSILEQFLIPYRCACNSEEKVSSILNSFPRQQGWKRGMYEVSQDLHFKNPIIRALNNELWDDEQHKNYKEENKNKNEDEKMSDIDWKIAKNCQFINGRELIDQYLVNQKIGDTSYQAYSILMTIMQKVLTMKDQHKIDMSPFMHFFNDISHEGTDDERQKYSFARKLDNQRLRTNVIAPPILHLYPPPDMKEKCEIPIADRKNTVENYMLEDPDYKEKFIDTLNEDKPMENIINYFVDFKSVVIDQKLDNYLDYLKQSSGANKDQNKRAKIEEFTEYNLAKTILDINEQYKADIDNQNCIKAIIDFQYKQKTQNYFIMQGTFFVLVVVIPFLFGLLDTGLNRPTRYIFDIIFLFGIIVLLMFEIIQWQEDGFLIYYKDLYNKIDSIMIGAGLVSAVIRVIENETWLPVQKVQERFAGKEDTGEELFFGFIMILNVTIFILFFLKTLFYFRANQEFGLLAELIWGIFNKLIPFTFFMFFIVFGFTIVFWMLGANFGHDYQLEDIVELFMNVFLMVEAVINNPSHPFWTDYKEGYPQYWSSNIVVYIIWALWLLFQVVMAIILINFLIALITQVYEEISEKANVSNYKHKAELNKECYQFYRFIGKYECLRKLFGVDELQDVDCFILQAQDDSDNRWQGYTKKLRKHLQNENKSLTGNVVQELNRFKDRQKHTQDQLMKEQKQALDELKKTLKTKIIELIKTVKDKQGNNQSNQNIQ